MTENSLITILDSTETTLLLLLTNYLPILPKLIIISISTTFDANQMANNFYVLGAEKKDVAGTKTFTPLF